MSAILGWLISLLLPQLEKFFEDEVKKWLAQREAQSIGIGNAEALKKATAGGNLDDMEKAGKDLLNGSSPK